MKGIRERFARALAGSGEKRARDTTLTPGCHDAMFPRSGLSMSSGVPLTVLCFFVLIVAGVDESGKSTECPRERTRERVDREHDPTPFRSFPIERRTRTRRTLAHKQGSLSTDDVTVTRLAILSFNSSYSSYWLREKNRKKNYRAGIGSDGTGVCKL